MTGKSAEGFSGKRFRRLVLHATGREPHNATIRLMELAGAISPAKNELGWRT